MNATMNGRARKSLAEQIDRLDTLLDGLAENLNDAIATAVEQAVKQVLVEVLTSAELQQRLQQAQEVKQPEPSGPSMLTKLANLGQRVGRWIGDKVSTGSATVSTTVANAAENCRKRWNHVTSRCAETVRQVTHGVLAAWLLLHGLRHLAGFVIAALAVGAAAGVGAYLLGPTIAAAISGTTGFVATLAVQTTLWLRQTFLECSGDVR